MEEYRKCKVVLLPVKSSKVTGEDDGSLLLRDKEVTTDGIFTPMGIFICSSEEIKEGDKDFWIIANTFDKQWNNVLKQVKECNVDPLHGKVFILEPGFLFVEEGIKIIATTDTSLLVLKPYMSLHESLPGLSNSFISHYIQEYNKGTKIEEVQVAYELMDSGGINSGLEPSRLKVDKNNQISIRSVKDSFSLKEVRVLFNKFRKDVVEIHKAQITNVDLDKWLLENL